jgi:prepilin-type N-terminal cleavage/methylation domain-containing protein
MKKKRALTLIEIMVVLFIITIVTSVIGVNMKGTMKEGKAFKSEKGSKQVFDVLSLEMAKNAEIIDSIIEHPEIILRNSGIVSDPKKILQDGWGEPFAIKFHEADGELKVTSKKWIAHLKGKGLSKEQICEQYPWVDADEVQEDLYTY